MGRRALTEEDRAEIAVGVKAGWTLTKIADGIGRCKSIVSREVRRNATATGRYRSVHAGRAAAARRSRPQLHAVAADPVLLARVRADLRRSRSLRPIHTAVIDIDGHHLTARSPLTDDATAIIKALEAQALRRSNSGRGCRVVGGYSGPRMEDIRAGCRR